MKHLARFWTNLDQPIDRGTYLRHGLGLAAVKYAGDVALVWLASGRFWTPVDYLQSVYSLLSLQIDGAAWLLPALGAWTLPFVWLGVTLSLRRTMDAGLPGWWAFFFFVPYVNYVLMIGLACASTETPRQSTRYAAAQDTRRLGPAVKSVTAGGLFGLVAVAIVVTAFMDYGVTLFFGVPFAMGALTGFIFNRRYDASGRETFWITTVTFGVVAGVTFLLAAEGAICIVMALPLAAGVGFFGAALGRVIARTGQQGLPPALLMLAAVPLSASLEPAVTGRVLHEVRTAIEIDAPPADVWEHVIAFRPIPEPNDLLFRLGVAYPQSARLEGQGAGAVRYCVFSTGAFVEPITHWERGRRLSFDVSASPAPLRELTIYDDVSPPHLDGYLRSRRGEFRLIALPGSRTRLEGSTWYELKMAPEGYWQIFSDYLIQRIHRRVLDHIKREVESR